HVRSQAGAALQALEIREVHRCNGGGAERAAPSRQARDAADPRPRHLRDPGIPAPDPRLLHGGEGGGQTGRVRRRRGLQPFRDAGDAGQSLRSARPRGAGADAAHHTGVIAGAGSLLIRGGPCARYDDRLTTSYRAAQIVSLRRAELRPAEASMEGPPMQLKHGVALVALVAVSAISGAGRAETPEQWIEFGARVHGGFGAFIPAGIRIGLDALERLKAERRGVTVTFYSGEKAPCP